MALVKVMNIAVIVSKIVVWQHYLSNTENIYFGKADIDQMGENKTHTQPHTHTHTHKHTHTVRERESGQVTFSTKSKEQKF